jgi:hypothetical protein
MLKRIGLGCAAAALTLCLAGCEEPLQVATGLYRAPDGTLNVVARACFGHGVDGVTFEDDTPTDGNPNNVNSIPVDMHFIFWSHNHGAGPDFAVIPFAGNREWSRHQPLYELLPGRSYGVSASGDSGRGNEVPFAASDVDALRPGRVRWVSAVARSVTVTSLAEFTSHACDGVTES